MKKLILFLLSVPVVLGVAAYFFMKKTAEAVPVSVNVVTNSQIDKTENTIVSLRNIGQWEFLTIDVEELVDTAIAKTFGADRISCIYKGTCRLGIDMADESLCISTSGDTAFVKLPQAKLLDEHFLQDAKTQVFFQDGDFAPVVMESLKRRAQQRMKVRALTDKNLRQTEANARSQIAGLLKASGFTTTIFE